jgi:hypothetical protein
MERTEIMITPTDFFGEAIKGLLFAAIGWFASTLSTQRKFDDFEKRVVVPLRDGVSKLEGASTLFATREELKSEIASLRTDFKDAVAEVRTDFKEAVSEVKQLIRDLRTSQ